MDAVRSYLTAIGRIPLLKPEQEGELSRKIQAAILLQESLGNQPPTAEQAKVLAIGKRAKDQMITANLRLVVSIAKKYQNRGLSLLELINEGSIGIIRAAEKFDFSKGYKFSTYAYWWIRQNITRALPNQSNLVRLPIHIIEKLNKVKKAQRQLTTKLNRTPTQAELEEYINDDKLDFTKLRDANRCLNVISLDFKADENDASLSDCLPYIDEYPEVLALRSELELLLNVLPAREREVVVLRSGLDCEALSLIEVGARLNISRERVRQIEDKATRRMRRYATGQ